MNKPKGKSRTVASISDDEKIQIAMSRLEGLIKNGIETSLADLAKLHDLSHPTIKKILKEVWARDLIEVRPRKERYVPPRTKSEEKLEDTISNELGIFEPVVVSTKAEYNDSAHQEVGAACAHYLNEKSWLEPRSKIGFSSGRTAYYSVEGFSWIVRHDSRQKYKNLKFYAVCGDLYPKIDEIDDEDGVPRVFLDADHVVTRAFDLFRIQKAKFVQVGDSLVQKKIARNLDIPILDHAILGVGVFCERLNHRLYLAIQAIDKEHDKNKKREACERERIPVELYEEYLSRLVSLSDSLTKEIGRPVTGDIGNRLFVLGEGEKFSELIEIVEEVNKHLLCLSVEQMNSIQRVHIPVVGSDKGKVLKYLIKNQPNDIRLNIKMLCANREAAHSLTE